MEKKLNDLFDSLTPEELSLAGEETRIEQSLDKKTLDNILSLTQRKAGITMTTKTEKRKRRLTRTSIIAIAAAAVLSCTAAAAGIVAVHEQTVNKYFGTGAAAELAKKGIMVNKIDVNDHFKFTIDTAYSTGSYTRLLMTIEGDDEAGRKAIEEHPNFDVDTVCLNQTEDIDSFGKDIDYEYNEDGSITLDMELDVDLSKGNEYSLLVYPITQIELETGVRPETLGYVASLSLEIEKNIEPVYFESAGGYSSIWICDYELYTPDAWQSIPYYTYIEEDESYYGDEDGGPTKEEHNAEYEAHKGDTALTFIYKDGTKVILTVEDVKVSQHTKFMHKSIDSQQVEKIIIGDGKIEYTRK